MKTLFIILFSFIIFNASAQEFSGSGIGYTLTSKDEILYTHPSFIQIINNFYFELGTGFLKEDQYVALSFGYAVNTGLNVKSYVVPNFNFLIGKTGIIEREPGMILIHPALNYCGLGISLITHFSDNLFVLVGVGVNQPIKAGIGYKFN
jgi:hypothetical protein